MSGVTSPWWQLPAPSSSFAVYLETHPSPRNCSLSLSSLRRHSFSAEDAALSLALGFLGERSRKELRFKSEMCGQRQHNRKASATGEPASWGPVRGSTRLQKKTGRTLRAKPGAMWTLAWEAESLASPPLPGKGSRGCLKLAALKLDTTPTPQ